MKKFFTKDNVGSVVQSLVASIIFLYLLEPLVEIMKNLGNGLINSFVDYFYLSCAQINGITFLSSITFLIILCYVFDKIEELLLMNIFSTEINNSIEINQNMNTNLTSQDLEKNIKEIILEDYKCEKQEIQLKSMRRILRRVTPKIYIILWILFLSYIGIYQYGSAIMNEQFNKRIIQITPYTDTREINLLKSEWVSMECKDDYEQIEQKINDILSKNNLK